MSFDGLEDGFSASDRAESPVFYTCLDSLPQLLAHLEVVLQESVDFLKCLLSLTILSAKESLEFSEELFATLLALLNIEDDTSAEGSLLTS